MLHNHTNPNQVFMIGWEYPPHNSGGLGVACAGLTKALAAAQSQVLFALPYAQTTAVDHMRILGCADPSWSETGTATTSGAQTAVGASGTHGTPANTTHGTAPPFLAYTPLYGPNYDFDSDPTSTSNAWSPRDLRDGALRALPQSELEAKVQQYADQVTSAGSAHADHYSIIHAHDWMSFPAALKLKQKTHKPLIAHVHSTEYDRSGLNTGSHYITHTEYEGMRGADRVIAVSHYTKRLLVDKYGIDSNKISVVHNGIDPLAHQPDRGWHHFAHKRPVVAFMGRLTLQKGGDFFLQVARKVAASIPEVLFIIAGSGDMYHELLFKTAAHGLSASVLFSGFVRSTQREKLLNRADVFMMPSVSEPFGLVALEAAQRHIPVIVSKNAGVSEVMPSSISLDFWDVDAMSSALVRLLQDNQHAHQVRTGQLDDLAELGWDSAAQRVQAIYREVFLGSR